MFEIPDQDLSVELFRRVLGGGWADVLTGGGTETVLSQMLQTFNVVVLSIYGSSTFRVEFAR